MKRTNETFSDWERERCCRSGAVTTVLGPQLGGCVRAGCGRVRSSDCFKDHSHTDRPGAEREGRLLRRLETAVVGSICLVLDGRPGVQCDVLIPVWPTVGCNFRGNGWERDMLFIGLCGRVRGDGS